MEIQLGTTDETHIIRTIEYWDIERRRYPGIDHVAVIAAEGVSGRFFNVISLLGDHVPIVALKVTAFPQQKGKIPLHFFKVLDTRDLIASIAEDEKEEIADEAFWIAKSSEKQVNLAKEIISEITGGDPYYVKFYIATELQGTRTAKLKVTPRRNRVLVRIRLPESDGITNKISDSGIYDSYRRGNYWFHLLSRDDLKNNRKILRGLFYKAIGTEARDLSGGDDPENQINSPETGEA